MAQFVTEIRITVEFLITIGALIWAARSIASAISLRNQVLREIDASSVMLDSTQSQVRKLQSATTKIKDQIIPSQIRTIEKLEKELSDLEEQVEKSQINEKLKLYQEVRQHWTEDPQARYFHASDWKPMDDVP